MPCGRRACSCHAGLKFALSAVEESLGGVSTALPAHPGRGSLGAVPVELTERTGIWPMPWPPWPELEVLRDDSSAKGLTGRATEMAGQLTRIAEVTQIEGARSAELGPRGFILHLLPFEVAERFQGQVQARRRAWIFTSATLSVGEDFSHFPPGWVSEEAERCAFPAPSTSNDVVAVAAAGLPEPAAADFISALLDASLPLIDAARGGAFILFTSHRALAEAAMRLRALWNAASNVQLLAVQGEAPREQLLRGLSRGRGCGAARAPPVSGRRGREGHRVAVIIEKLPFASPEIPSSRRGSTHPAPRRQSLQGLSATGSGADVTPGCRPPDPQRGDSAWS